MAKVSFIRRETDEELNNVDLVDGQFMVSGEGTTYIDYGEKRIGLGATADNSFDETSLNAIQNKVVTEKVNDFESRISTIESNGLTFGTVETIDDTEETS